MDDTEGRDMSAAPEDSGQDSVQPETQPVDAPEASDQGVPEEEPTAEIVQEQQATESLAPEAESAAEAEPEASTADGDEETDAEPAAQAEDAENSETDTEAISRVDSAEAPGIDDTPSSPVGKPRIPWWPFLVYLVAWIGVIGAAFYLISYGPEDLPAFQQEAYPYILLAGLVLTVLGPLLSFLVWIIKWVRTPKGERGGLLTSALLKGALVTCFGVLAWWGAIVVLDALRLGLIGPIS